MPEPPAGPTPPTLPDPWESRLPILLDGRLERSGFAPLLMAAAGLVLAFILFQIVISPAVTLLLLMGQGVPLEELLSGLAAVIEEHARSILVANTIGQILGLAVPALLLARFHSSRPSAFLRLRSTDAAFVILAIIGLIALTPTIQWLGSVNDTIPLPEFIRRFEDSQMELIEQMLRVDTGLAFNLFVLALTPAVCEELLFRGYVQREAERGAGILVGILISGIVFGLYHLRLTQAIPLCVLGVYLAWLTWRTGSLLPAMFVHFTNNAIAIAVGAYVARRADLELEDLEAIELPWYLVVLGLIVFGASVLALQRLAVRILARRGSGTSAWHEPPRTV